jgi:O-antigen/teichoic acid export membrane protein
MRLRLLGPKLLFKHRREAASVIMRASYTGLAFLVTVLLARLLTSAELGRYFEILAWVLLISAAVQTGWGPYLVREVAFLREHERPAELAGTAWLATRIVGAASIVAALAMIAITYAAGAQDRNLRLVWLAAPIIPILAATTMRQSVTIGMGHPLLGQLCDTIVRPGVQVAALVAWWAFLSGASLGPSGAVAILLAATLISAAGAFLLERRATARVRKAAVRKVPRPSEWLGPLARIALMAWSSAVNLQIGTLVLANVAADAEIATFRIAQQLSLLMTVGLTAVAALYGADLSRSFARGDFAWMQRLAGKGALVSLLAALPLAAAYAGFGPSIIRLLFGSQYDGAYIPLLILAAGQLANAAFGLAAATAVAARSETAALRAYLTSAILNLLLCLLLAPGLGAVGAAAASSLALVAWNLMLYVHLRKRLGVDTFVALGPALGLVGKPRSPRP